MCGVPMQNRTHWPVAAAIAVAAWCGAAEPDAAWRETLVRAFGAGPSRAVAAAMKQFPSDRLRLAVVADWVRQDKLDGKKGLHTEAVGAALDAMGSVARDLRAELGKLAHDGVPASDPRWARLYLQGCERRRAARLSSVLDRIRRVVFTKHFDLGGSHYAYTEGQSDAQRERHFKPGSSLCLLAMDGLYGKVRALLDDRKGVIRDPDVSFDATRILFAWKKDLNKDDYHLYEMTVADGAVRQLTHGLGFADYEGAYLPSGDIVFNSTRCVQTVDCWWTEVSNLYTCDADGRYLRRLSYDQVHTNYPTVAPDGRVVYTRWDYNDRGQIYPQGLFQMNPDGTAQTAVYGNNSWFPTAILHARAIPGTQKVVCVFSGHHTRQNGWLGLLDLTRDREENAGTQLIAPIRETRAVHVDRYGQTGDQWQYPYPLSDTEFLVAFRPAGAKRFAIYWMNVHGERELLASDPAISCNQPVLLAARPVPHRKPSLVRYRRPEGTVFLHDIHVGPGLASVPRGTVKGLRVIALDFRAAGIGRNGNRGPAGGAMISTPVSIQGTWDVKRVLGTATVHPDGSACFTVPARTAIYFQALDAKGHAVQTMRSWSTLQPGETLSCVGCHESKGTAPPMTHTAQALTQAPQRLTPPLGEPRGFSFIRDLQPILDRHCVRCHHLDTPPHYASLGQTLDAKTMRIIVPCKGATWRYTVKEPADGWTKPVFDDSAWRLGKGGFGRKGTPGSRIGTLWHTKHIWLRRTFELKAKPTAPALLVHHDEDTEVYLNGVLAGRASGYTRRYVMLPMSREGGAALKAGRNTMAVHCKQTLGGQYIDAAVVDTMDRPAVVASKPSSGIEPAFSLRGKQTLEPTSLRKWSDAYKALANRSVCNWVNVQSAPPMLPPYHAGAARSKLITMLEAGHNGVKLSPAELGRVALWIDLLVPYCGDYREAMDDKHVPRYNHFLAKRRRWEAREAANIAAWLDAGR